MMLAVTTRRSKRTRRDFSWRRVGTLRSKEWSEDPLIVSVDAVVSDDRVTPAATGYSDERTCRVFRIVLVTWSVVVRFNIRKLIDDYENLCIDVWDSLFISGSRHRAAVIEHNLPLKFDHVRAFWLHQLPFAGLGKWIYCSVWAQDLKLFRAPRQSLQQLLH